MNLTNSERETILNFNESEDTASVYTHSRALRRKLDKLSADRPEECRLVKTCHDGQATEFCVPKNWIRINPPRKGTPLTEIQRQQRREQLAKARKS